MKNDNTIYFNCEVSLLIFYSSIHSNYYGCQYWQIIGFVGFVYIKSNQVAENVIIPPNAPGCNCKGKCTNAEKCSCARLNGNDFPYVHRDGGR